MIAGERPDEYVHFDDKFDDDKRIDQVIAWLNLPPAKRPHFITLYYSNTDHAGHLYGPDSTEERDQVHHVDALIGKLKRDLDATHLPIDLIILADHGMVRSKATGSHWIKYADLTRTSKRMARFCTQTRSRRSKSVRELSRSLRSSVHSLSPLRRARVSALQREPSRR